MIVLIGGDIMLFMGYKLAKKYNHNGVVPSPEDNRDYQLSSLVRFAVKLPESYINPCPLHIFDQKDTGACVAAAIAQAKHIIENRQTHDPRPFSPMYIYAKRDDDNYKGPGGIPREFIKNLMNYGICHYDEFEGFVEYPEASEIYKNNRTHLDGAAYPYRISSFYALNNIEEVKIAIYTLGFALIAYDINKYFYTPDKHTGIVKYSKIARSQGAHEVLGIGFNKDGIICANSWGTSYGIGFDENKTSGGMMIVPYKYQPLESWALVDDITERNCMELNGDIPFTGRDDFEDK